MIKKLLSIFFTLTLMLAAPSCGAQNTGNKGDNAQSGGTDAANGVTGEITVAFYDTQRYDRFVFEATMLFERTHPGTRINIEGFSEMPEMKEQESEDGSSVTFVITEDDSQAVKDYISRTSAELMSGKGADIIAADVLPWYKYAENGSFVDMLALMEGESGLNPNDYRANVFESVRYKGGQYIIPVDFALPPIITFDKTKFDGARQQTLKSKNAFTYWELTDLIDGRFSSGENTFRAIDLGASSMISSLFNLDYGNYVDLENKKCYFTDGDFARMLGKIDEQRKKGYFKPEYSSVDEMAQDYTDSLTSYYYKNQSHWVLPQIFFAGIYGAQESVRARISEPDEIAGVLKNDKGDAPFKYLTAFGINANSKNKELAWEFMKFMLSKEGQESFSLIGLPVHNAAFISRAKFLYNDSDAENAPAYKDYINCLNTLIDELSGGSATDKIINNMASNEIALFLDGRQSADEAAAALQNKVSLYLSE